MSAIDRLRQIMVRLRDPAGGCPWDREQDWASIAPHTIEEAYELADAIARGEPEAVRDELGDVLFQVVFQSRIAEERGLFDFDAVAASIADKLERRQIEIDRGDRTRTHEELGDLLFALSQAARHLGVDAEAALRDANAKFERRFRRVESHLAAAGQTPADVDMEQLEALWVRAKRELG